MRQVQISEIEPAESASMHVVHRSANVLIFPQEPLTENILALITNEGIDAVYMPDANEGMEKVKHQLTKRAIALTDLKPGENLAQTIYDDNGRLLLEAGATIPKSFVPAMEKRGITTTYSMRDPAEIGYKEGVKLRKKIEAYIKDGGDVPPPPAEIGEKIEEFRDMEIPEAAAEDLEEDSFRKKLDKIKKIEVLADGEPFQSLVNDEHKMTAATKEEKKFFSSVIEDSLKTIKEIFDSLVVEKNRNLNLDAMNRIISNAMGGMIHNKDLLTLCGMQKTDFEYPVPHALAAAVLSINVGCQMGFDAQQIKSLAYGAMLSDVGMLMVPPEIVMKEGPLTPIERAKVRQHPSYGLEILQRARGVPQEVPYVVYQSHERANGTGYPCGKSEVVIHPFAQIVGMVDTYVGLCSDRPHRPGKSSYTAMEHLLRMCGKRFFSRPVTEAILKSNSLFPIGTFVALSDEKVGRVVSSNGSNYMQPVVAVLFKSRNFDPVDEVTRVDLSNGTDLKITAALEDSEMPEEMDAFAGF